MKIVGCDFHPGHQQVSMLDTVTGEEMEMKLGHADGEAERFYCELEAPALHPSKRTARWPGAPALVGMEAVGNSLCCPSSACAHNWLVSSPRPDPQIVAQPLHHPLEPGAMPSTF